MSLKLSLPNPPVVLKSSLQTLLKADESENNPLLMSDEQILEQIYSTHVHSDTKFDVNSLFTLVQNTLRRSTHIVDNVVQGSSASVEHVDDTIPPASFTSPLCTLKAINSEMSCKPPGEQIAHKTTLVILNKLSNYDWDAKAVLTLAAFALEYSEFWLLAQHQTTDFLAKSVAVLKRVPALTRPAAVQKHRQAIIEVNNLVKTTLQVIELIFELEKLSTHNTKEVPALVPAIEQLPVDVYWTIITITAIVTQIDILTTESEQKQELSQYGQKINIILSKLRKQVTIIRQQIDEVIFYGRLKKALLSATEIRQVFKLLIFSTADTPQQLFDGATKTTVDISVLNKRNVYFFISTLDITDEEISEVKPVYDATKTNEQYKIVWIPIVEEWNDQLRKKFEILKTKVPWYVVPQFGNKAGIRYIKEEWHFTKKPLVALLSPQGKVDNTDVFQTIHAYGIKAFPFRKVDVERVEKELHWIESVVGGIDGNLLGAIKEQKYIFFYGGHDKEWIQQFTKYVNVIANDTVIKESKIAIELFHVEKENKSLFGNFWTKIESLFVTKGNNTVDEVTQQVQKMLSYKNETGWALLTKGSSVVVSGHGTTILKTVAEFEKWKDTVSKNGFEFSFKVYHEKIVKTTHRCAHLEIPNVTGKLPRTIKCPDCPNTMEIFISYKCCHNG
ncbi:hypothetical protein RIF29_21483 [Crotalaria pallida]|uniref:Uncharacterized protein n=1 Tax=Crotalaria pallida TaxID=3830 RepID=A0AAN9F5E2_CROPI